jgi:hypothetical protein
MSIRITPQVMEALVQVISGGPGNSEAKPVGIYRSGPQIESFLRACGAEVVTQGSRLPSLYASLERVLGRADASEILTHIAEAAADPADFPDPEHHQRVVEYLNARLRGNGMVLRLFDGRMRCHPLAQSAPVIAGLAERVGVFRFDTVQADLDRAMQNCATDPEDAVTSASSLLESMCRSILIEMKLPLPEKKDLGSLYKAVRDPLALNAAWDDLPVEISNDVRTILGGLTTIVQGVGALRTHAGDAHGRERGHPKIDGRIARLALHTASAAALFLLETWERRTGRGLPRHQ